MSTSSELNDDGETNRTGRSRSLPILRERAADFQPQIGRYAFETDRYRLCISLFRARLASACVVFVTRFFGVCRFSPIWWVGRSMGSHRTASPFISKQLTSLADSAFKYGHRPIIEQNEML